MPQLMNGDNGCQHRYCLQSGAWSPEVNACTRQQLMLLAALTSEDRETIGAMSNAEHCTSLAITLTYQQRQQVLLQQTQGVS